MQTVPKLLLVPIVLSACGATSPAAEDEAPGAVERSGSGGTNAAGGASTTGGGASESKALGGSSGVGGNAASAGAGAGGTAASRESDAGGAPGGNDGGHVVGKCDSLPTAGTWELISPKPWASRPKLEATCVLGSPEVSGTLYAVGSDKTNGGNGGTGFYRSTDCGSTWVKVSTGMHGADLDTGAVWDCAIDHNNGQRLWAVNGYGGPPSLFRSDNGGVDWNVLMPDRGDLATAIGGNFVQHFGLDPADGNHVIATFHFNCTGQYAPQCMAETTNAGGTWRPFKGPSNGWDEGSAQPLVLGKTTWAYVNWDGLSYTKDSGASWEKVTSDGGGGNYTASDGTIYVGGNSHVLRSTDGHAWTSITNSPKASAIVIAGNSMYASFFNDFSGQPMYTASVGDVTKWTNMKTPAIAAGGRFFSFDADHHVLYGAFGSGGVWRYVTP